MLIGNRRIKEGLINLLIQDIKKKKELAYLADSFVKESLKHYLQQNAPKVNFLIKKFNEKSKEYKQIVKEVRKELRKVYALYKIEQEIEHRQEYFAQLLKTKPKEKEFLELHQKILETHASTRERLSFYKKLYPQLFKITGEPKTLLDLGCGLNPFSFPFMRLKKLKFYAYDISTDEISMVKRYFRYLGKHWPRFSGKASLLDLRHWEKIKKLKKVDLCFLWKMTDVLDRQKGHKVSELVIVNVPAKYVVVSFPTLTVKGRKMNKPRRKWIELMCRRLKYHYKIIKEENEIFYIIKK